MARPAMAQIQGEGQRNGRTTDDIPDGFISWDEHYLAWGVWSKRQRVAHSAEEVERMGGLSYRQVAELLGHNPVTWELRDPHRYALFLLSPEDGPPDLTATVQDKTPPLRSHVRDGASEKEICKMGDDAPDGFFFFDAAKGPHCSKCETKMELWLSWWIDTGKQYN